jgi:hypothetical protein
MFRTVSGYKIFAVATPRNRSMLPISPADMQDKLHFGQNSSVENVVEELRPWSTSYKIEKEVAVIAELVQSRHNRPDYRKNDLSAFTRDDENEMIPSYHHHTIIILLILIIIVIIISSHHHIIAITITNNNIIIVKYLNTQQQMRKKSETTTLHNTTITTTTITTTTTTTTTTREKRTSTNTRTRTTTTRTTTAATSRGEIQKQFQSIKRY